MKSSKVSIVTLCKNNSLEFSRTFRSVASQLFAGEIFWYIVDGSSDSRIASLMESVQIFLQRCSAKFKLFYFSTFELGIHGIYPSLNYISDFLVGDYVIYMNSGDLFFSSASLQLLYSYASSCGTSAVCVFGQALTVSHLGFAWRFPSRHVYGILAWLRYFEPNHQSMLVSIDLAVSLKYDENLTVSADKIWKRSVVQSSRTLIYLPFPVCIFFLCGISSSKRSWDSVKEDLKAGSISFLTKLSLLIKYFIPAPLFYYFPFVMYLKSCVTSIPFSRINPLFLIPRRNSFVILRRSA